MTVRETGAPAPEEAVGRRMETADVLAPAPARRLAATFDRDPDALADGARLPHGWHWLYFLDAPRGAAVGADGRTVSNGFLPETGLPRRMWAGGSFRFDRDLVLGRAARAEVAISDVARKEGRSGKLAFVTTEHRLEQDGAMALVETRDLVFREAPRPGETVRRADPPAAPAWRRTVEPDPVLLFRFSALTFNAHRIHYDIDYCRDVEGYPGLVVHGPMLALLLLDLAERELGARTFRRFRYRAVAPLFAPDRFHVCGAPEGAGRALFWIESADGALAMSAELDLA